MKSLKGYSHTGFYGHTCMNVPMWAVSPVLKDTDEAGRWLTSGSRTRRNNWFGLADEVVGPPALSGITSYQLAGRELKPFSYSLEVTFFKGSPSNFNPCSSKYKFSIGMPDVYLGVDLFFLFKHRHSELDRFNECAANIKSQRPENQKTALVSFQLERKQSRRADHSENRSGIRSRIKNRLTSLRYVFTDTLP